MLEFSYITHSVPLLKILRQGECFTVTFVRVQATYTPTNREVMVAVRVVSFKQHFSSTVFVFVMVPSKKGRACVLL